MCNLYSDPGLCNLEIISLKLVTWDLFTAAHKKPAPWLVSVCLPVDTYPSPELDTGFTVQRKKEKKILVKLNFGNVFMYVVSESQRLHIKQVASESEQFLQKSELGWEG